jgi:hypothetical protein
LSLIMGWCDAQDAGRVSRNNHASEGFYPQRLGPEPVANATVSNTMEQSMRSKFLAGAPAFAVTAAAILATAGPASAQRWHRAVGWGVAGAAAGVVGGVAAAATAPWWAPGYYGGYGYSYAPGYAYDDTYAYAPGYVYGTAPGYTYAPGYAYGGRDDAYCAQRYRSYDPASGTYLGFDGVRHSCP